jgi:hypothetical protein
MEPEQVAVERYKAEQMLKSTAGWFWWIGALSLVNSFLASSGKQFTFTFGLGVSQIGDTWMAGDSAILEQIGIFLSYGFPGLFFLLAWLTKHTEVALPIGVGLYTADALLFLFAQDWLGLGFHAFALVLIGSGWRAYRKLAASLPKPVASEVTAVTPPAV